MFALQAERCGRRFAGRRRRSASGRCWRRRRPRMRWPVPKASMVTPLRSTIMLPRHTSPRPTAAGKSLASRRFSSSSALMFSRSAQAWCLVSETIQISVPTFDGRAERQGQRADGRFGAAPRAQHVDFRSRATYAPVELFGQPAVHVRRRPAKMLGQVLLAPGQQVEAIARAGPRAVPGRGNERTSRATRPRRSPSTHRARATGLAVR